MPLRHIAKSNSLKATNLTNFLMKPPRDFPLEIVFSSVIYACEKNLTKSAAEFCKVASTRGSDSTAWQSRNYGPGVEEVVVVFFL